MKMQEVDVHENYLFCEMNILMYMKTISFVK